MSLANLLKIGQIKEHRVDAEEIDRLLAALMMHGYRPDPHRLGHQMTVVQSLTHTIDLNAKRMVVLDTLRRQRNMADYSGVDIDESTVGHCIAEARRLVDDVFDWRERNRPELRLNVTKPRP